MSSNIGVRLTTKNQTHTRQKPRYTNSTITTHDHKNKHPKTKKSHQKTVAHSKQEPLQMFLFGLTYTLVPEQHPGQYHYKRACRHLQRAPAGERPCDHGGGHGGHELRQAEHGILLRKTLSQGVESLDTRIMHGVYTRTHNTTQLCHDCNRCVECNTPHTTTHVRSCTRRRHTAVWFHAGRRRFLTK